MKVPRMPDEPDEEPLVKHCDTCKCDEPLADPGKNKRGKVRKNAHDTEEWAADAVLETSGRQRLSVLAYIWDCGSRGTNDYEGRTGMGMEGRSSFSTRRAELVKQGWVVDSGRKRPTNTPCFGIVWVLSRRGHRDIGTVDFG